MTASTERSSRKERDADLPPALSSLWRMTKLAYSIEPRLLVVSLVMTLALALPQSLIGLWLAVLVDGLHNHDRSNVYLAAAGLAVSATLMWWLQVVFDRLSRRFRDRISIAMEARVAELHATVATIAHQERREHMDRLEILRRNTFGLDHLFMSLFSTLGWVLRLAAVEILLMTQVSPSLGLLVLFALPTVVAATWRPGVEREVREQVSSHDRRARHLFVLGTTPAPGKELRVTGNGDALVARRRTEWEAYAAPLARATWVTAAWNALAWAVFGLGYVGAIVLTAGPINGTPGQVVLVLVIGSQLSQFVGAAVGELGFLRSIWLDISRRLMWLEDYAAAVDARSDGIPPDRLERGIRLEHVSFRYPGTDRLVLEDVTLDLPAGAVVAVVGDNGSGKTTLVKLLARLYDPTEGRIEVDGVDLASISVPQWRDRLAGAFQDFFRFELRAQQAVGVGDLDRLDDRPAAEAAVARAGAGDVVDRLPAGLDTQLGPAWDEGVEVSFGQWQKLALARGFMREEPLLLALDEPTAALDAETEHALFERFAAAAHHEVRNGRVTVLVSHRFSTVRMADAIVVLDGARVAEIGSHAELMALGGRYAELYGIQSAAFPVSEPSRLRDDPDWRRFLSSRLVSITGSSVTYVALPVLVYSMTSSPLLTSVVASLEALPYLMFGLPAGALADRFDRKRVMVLTDLVNAVVLATVPVAAWFGVLTVPHVLAVAFLVPTLFVFFDAADFGALPTLVGRARIVVANSAVWSASTVVETVVPVLAGAAFAVVSPSTLVGVDALSYVGSAVLIRAIVRPLSGPVRAAAAKLTRRALLADVREGLRFLWGHETVRTMTIVGATQSLCGGAFVGLLVVWADRVLGVRQGDWRLGVVFGSWGIGVLLTTLLTPRVVRRYGAARVTLYALPVSLLMSVLVTLAQEWVAASIATALWGVAYMAVVLNAITYRQQVTPEPLMSRVNTTGRMLSFGLGTPLGALLGGLVAEATGPRGGMLAGSAVLAGGVVVAWTSPLRGEGAVAEELTG